MPEDLSFETRCVHAGDEIDVRTRPVAPPLYATSVFETPTLEIADRAMTGDPGYYAYSRNANPTVVALEQAVAALDSGVGAVATASGMGAISTLFLALLATGDRVVAAHDLYGTTTTLLSGPLAGFGIATDFVDASDVRAVEAACRPGTRLLLVETVSNPLMRVVDIPALAAMAHACGALLAVDASFTTPALSQPLAQGADVVVHSATKYLGGHSDVTAGVVVADSDVTERVRRIRTTFGAVCSPLDAWLTLRGLKTLALRMERHSANAQCAAEFLGRHPKVRRVHYAGLKTDPHHDVARRVLPRGTGGMLSFEIDGGRDPVDRFIAALKLIRFAPSLADVATTLSHPASTSHRGLNPGAREKLGITDGLIRLSVGIESPDDICADLERGLAAV